MTGVQTCALPICYVGSSFLCQGLLQSWQAGATPHHGARASHHRGPSCCGAQLQTRRLSNCGPRAQPLRGMRDPPRPGLEPVSPALAGRLSTTAPPGKPLTFYLSIYFYFYFWLCWVFVSVPGPSPVAASGGHSSSHCAGPSPSRPLLQIGRAHV